MIRPAACSSTGASCALFDTGRGAHYSVDTGLWIEPRPAVPLIVGTLGERVCRAAGQFADAIMTWLAPAAYISSIVRPAGGRERGGPAGAARDRRGTRGAIP